MCRRQLFLSSITMENVQHYTKRDQIFVERP